MASQLFWIGLLVTLLCVALKKCLLRPKNLPPGPTPFPFIGSIHLMVPNFIRNIPKLTGTYGDIVSISMFGKYFVVIKGYSLIKEAIVDCKSCANRPETLAIELRGLSEGIVTAPYSPKWAAQRKLFHVAMRNMGLNKHGIGMMIKEELPHFVNKFNEMAQDETLVDPIIAFDYAALNVMAFCTFGNRYSYGDSKFENLLYYNNLYFHKFGNLLSIGYAVVSLVPYLAKFWLPDAAKQIKMCCSEITKYVVSEIEYHKRTIDRKKPRDVIDYYLIEMESDNKLLYTKDGLVMTILDLFQGGTETITATLHWSALYMANNPDIQEKVHDEIVKQIGKDRFPTYEDRVNLPYTEAAIMEVQRKGSVTPIGLYRAAFEDCVLQGYNIPKDTTIIPYFPSFHHSPKFWKNPYHYDPENFLGPDGKVKKPEAFLPFGGGLRICLGMEMAKQEIFLFFAVMVQRFRLMPPEGVNELSEKVKGGGTWKPHPFKLRIEPRF